MKSPKYSLNVIFQSPLVSKKYLQKNKNQFTSKHEKSTDSQILILSRKNE
jgi:hypothetical protein